MEQLRKQAEELAEQRRIAREQAVEWTREIQMESDEERERKAKKAGKKSRADEGSGDEGAETKKKRRNKSKKGSDHGGILYVWLCADSYFVELMALRRTPFALGWRCICCFAAPSRPCCFLR